MSKILGAGIALILLGVILTFIGALTSSKTESNVAIGGFIGPIPFGFANNQQMFWVLIIVMILLLVLTRFR